MPIIERNLAQDASDLDPAMPEASTPNDAQSRADAAAFAPPASTPAGVADAAMQQYLAKYRASQPTPVDAISGVSAGDPLGPVAHMHQAQYAQAMAKTPQPDAAPGVDASAAHSALLQNAAANGGELHPLSAQIPGHDIREEAIRRSQMEYNIAQSTIHAMRLKNAYEQAMSPPPPDTNMMVHAAMAQTLMAPVAAQRVQEQREQANLPTIGADPALGIHPGVD